jgi:hypothetical protein
MNKTSKLVFLLIGIAIGLALCATGTGPDELEVELRQYCEMVALNRADPTVGWPDFHKTYDSECAPHEDESR